jgi:hypothetical protein
VTLRSSDTVTWGMTPDFKTMFPWMMKLIMLWSCFGLANAYKAGASTFTITPACFAQKNTARNPEIGMSKEACTEPTEVNFFHDATVRPLHASRSVQAAFSLMVLLQLTSVNLPAKIFTVATSTPLFPANLLL